MNYLEDHTERIPKHYVASSYLEPFLNPASLAKIARASAEKLQAFRFEAIAFRGVSGALIAPVLSIMMGKKLVCVRKPDERSHSDYPVEGAIADLGSYVIVDDFMASGETARSIIKAIYEQEPHARCIGLFEARYAATSQFNILRSLSDIGWQYPAEGLPKQVAFYEGTLPDGRVVRKRSMRRTEPQAYLECFILRGQWEPVDVFNDEYVTWSKSLDLNRTFVVVRRVQ